MKTNLIQTYMSGNSTANNKNDRNLNIEQVLSNRTFIKPLPGNGKIINRNIFEAPAAMAKNFTYDIKSFTKAAKGNANDHELGKINDLGMKIGGLAIAAYLITRKQTPLKKAMELVGLASFFGSMALWPALAIQLPTKLIHGFNPRKKYEDSFGREKLFYQDPMYIPWDLVDDKKIHKIGDRMRIPKDIPNRREFIQEKMRKTAVQDNTLWMFTAGLATPVMSALICNACEKPLNRFLGERTLRKADGLLDEFDYKKYLDNETKKTLDTILDNNTNADLSSGLSKQIRTLLTKDLDPITADAVGRDIDNFLGLNDKKAVIDDKFLEDVVSMIRKSMQGVIDESNAPDVATLKETLKDFAGKELSETDLKKITHVVGVEVKKTLKANNVDADNVSTIVDNLLNTDKSLLKTLKLHSKATLGADKVSVLKEVSRCLTDFKAKNAVLNEFVYLKTAAAPETVVANAWNEVTDSLPKLFNLTDKEITSARHDRKLAGKLLREKLEALAANPGEYNRVFSSLVEKINQLDSKVEKMVDPSSVQGSYGAKTETVFNEVETVLRKHNLHDAADSFVGKFGDPKGSLKNIQLSYVNDRLLGVRSSMYRLLNTMDFFKRIADKENIPALHSGMSKEVKEEIVEFAKNLSIEGATSDYMTKFYSLRNPNPAASVEQIVTENGKVVNEFLEKAVQGGRIDITNDKSFFSEVMKLLFENDVHSSSDKILSDVLMDKKAAFNQYRQAVLDEVGEYSYFVKQYHKVHGKGEAGTAFTRFLRVGMSPDQMLQGTAKSVFNTRKWLKMFGGFGAGLLGVTVLAQFFFGKMKTPERIKND